MHHGEPSVFDIIRCVSFTRNSSGDAEEDMFVKRIVIFLTTTLFFASSLTGSADAKTFLSIATGGTGGTYYPLGVGIADTLNRHLDDIHVSVRLGDASVANINLIGTHQVELAFAQNDIAYWGTKGIKPFKETFSNIRVIASLYPENVHCIALKKSNIKSISDFLGKRVSVGEPASGIQSNVAALLDVAGLKFSNMETDFLDFGSTAQRLRNGQIDIGFAVSGYPTRSVSDLALTTDIELVSFEDAFLDSLIAKYPFFVKSVIPSGTYKGTNRDIRTPAVRALLVCDAATPDDIIYRVTKIFWKNIEEIRMVHEKAKLLTLETALDGVSIKVHPGAAKFYVESGIVVPAPGKQRE